VNSCSSAFRQSKKYVPELSENYLFSLARISGAKGVPMPIVILKMRKGFSTEQKRTVVKEFTNTLVKTLGVDPDVVTIMIDEHDLENIGKAGKLRCDP
jgi:4-oxalocrotonate tautomerase family enzyme